MSVASFVDGITLDVLEDDPYPVYARLREHAPVTWVPAAGVWFMTRFDDCAAAGRGAYGFRGAISHPTLRRVFGVPNVLSLDGEEHDDLRRGIDPKLVPTAVSEYVDDQVRPVARAYVDRLLVDTPVEERRTARADLMASYFEPVSVEALRHVMGLDNVVDATTLRRWFADLNVGVSNFGMDEDRFAVADRANLEIEAVVRPLLDDLRRRPDGSMLSHMLWAGRQDGLPRPVDAILPSLRVILLGGMQEPGHAAGSTLLGLFGEPAQYERVRRTPRDLVPQAVNEGLRWIAPIGAVERQATTDVVVGRAEIRAGDIVQLMIGSANRDETRYADPQRFDMDRANRTHQAFGNGAHFCAGHFFARQVERIMLEELLTAVTDLQPDPHREAEVKGWVFRAPKTLPARWSARRPPERVVVSAAPRADAVAYHVLDLDRHVDDVALLTLRPADGGPVPRWAPGAHIDLWTGGGRSRQYSLCGAPGDRTQLQVAVLREMGGRGGSEYVFDVIRPGTQVWVTGPRNHFELLPAQRYLFIAGGIGITPLASMAAAAAAERADWSMLYIGRSRERMALLPQLAPFGDRVTVYATEQAGRPDLASALPAAGDGAVVYCCGPPALLQQVETLCSARGLLLRVERFTGVDAGPRVGDEPFMLDLAWSGGHVTVEATQTALEALHAAGYDIPSSCGTGTCGSCEIGVLSGEVDHRDVLLTDGDRRAGRRMMPCVSRAAGRLRIDL